jgi:hypothetical protein
MDQNIERTMKDLEQFRAVNKLRKEVAELVLRYGGGKMDADLMAGVFFSAGAMITNAMCAAKLKQSEARDKAAADEKGAKDESAS